jgi:hypothetical protein
MIYTPIAAFWELFPARKQENQASGGRFAAYCAMQYA